MAFSDARRRARAACPTDQLRWYANRTLPPEDYAAVAAHVAECAACQAEAQEWAELRQALRGVAAQTPEPTAELFALIERRLNAEPERAVAARLRGWLQGAQAALEVAGQHLLAQVRLLRRDLFWTPLLIAPVVIMVAYLPAPGAQAARAAALLAALIAALGMAFLSGQRADPAREIALATPTSPRLTLGVRLFVVFGYDLLINCGLALPFLALHGVVTPVWFVANWLAPLCLLSAVALLLSVALNASVAALICALLWALRLVSDVQTFLLGGGASVPTLWQRQYEAFWRQGPLLFVVAGLATLLAFSLVERKERFARC